MMLTKNSSDWLEFTIEFAPFKFEMFIIVMIFFLTKILISATVGPSSRFNKWKSDVRPVVFVIWRFVISG